MPPEGLDWLPSPVLLTDEVTRLITIAVQRLGVGVIGSVTRPFCGACDRVRLTADGQIRNCLFAGEESDLRTPLRAGAGDDEVARI